MHQIKRNPKRSRHIIVQKFGGTSVGDPERIQQVARKALSEQRRGNDVVVVVSAMAGTTDALIALGSQVSKNPCGPEFDLLLSTGEHIATALVALAIQNQGGRAKALTAHDVPILTDSKHNNARIRHIPTGPLLAILDKDIIPVVSGFQGVTETNEITTLGRGGSDTSAVALAVALQAERCDVYKDVDGVFQVDPRFSSNPKRISLIDYKSMLELSSSGAKVLHPRSVELAEHFDLPIRVLSSFESDGGTLVTKGDDLESCRVEAVAAQPCILYHLTISDEIEALEFLSKISEELSSIDFLCFQPLKAETHVSFTTSTQDFRRCREFVRNIASRPRISKELLEKVSLIGNGLRRYPGIIAKAIRSVIKSKCKIYGCELSEYRLCFIVSRDASASVVENLKEGHS